MNWRTNNDMHCLAMLSMNPCTRILMRKIFRPPALYIPNMTYCFRIINILIYWSVVIDLEYQNSVHTLCRYQVWQPGHCFDCRGETCMAMVMHHKNSNWNGTLKVTLYFYLSVGYVTRPLFLDITSTNTWNRTIHHMMDMKHMWMEIIYCALLITFVEHSEASLHV